MRTAVLSVAMLLFALDASAQQNIARCRNSSGTQGDCTSIGVAPAAALPIRGTTITATTQFTGSGAGLTSVPAASVVGAFSGVTINCASNTCSNIANAALLTGIDALKLGAGLVDNTEFGYLDGATSNIQAQLNALLPATSNRLPPAPSLAGKLLYDTGIAYDATAAACAAGYILNGGSPPNCSQTPTVGTSLTVPRINSTGSLILNGATGGNVQLSVDSTTVLTGAANGLTSTQPLAMSNQRITGLAAATTAGDALSYPWITATTASAVGTTTTLNQTTGVYQDITGLSISLAAGTHSVAANVRGEINELLTAGAYITCRLHDGTNPITNSETIVAQSNAVATLAQNTAPINMAITVGSTTSVKVQCARTFGGTIVTSDVPSDANGRSRIHSVQIAP